MLVMDEEVKVKTERLPLEVYVDAVKAKLNAEFPDTRWTTAKVRSLLEIVSPYDLLVGVEDDGTGVAFTQKLTIPEFHGTFAKKYVAARDQTHYDIKRKEVVTTHVPAKITFKFTASK